MEMGITIMTSHALNAVKRDHVVTACAYTGQEKEYRADAVLMVTARDGETRLWDDLKQRQDEWQDAGISSVKLIGDAAAPAPIAWATYAGHRYAMEMDTPSDKGDDPVFRREVAQLDNS